MAVYQIRKGIGPALKYFTYIGAGGNPTVKISQFIGNSSIETESSSSQ